MDIGQSRAHYMAPTSFPFISTSPRHLRADFPLRSSTAGTMDPNEMSINPDPVGYEMWSSVTPPAVKRSRPATIHESGFSYCIPNEPSPMPAWDLSVPLQPVNDGMTHHTYSPQPSLYPSPMEDNEWVSKTAGHGIGFQGLDTEMNIGQAYTSDEAIPVLDLRFSGSNMNGENLSTELSYNARRMSGSSFTMSTSGGLSEMPSYEDFAGSLSEAPSFTSDYPPLSNRNSLMSSTQLSPVASPRMTPQNRSELVRTQSRGRASPSPRPSMRSAPYNMDNRGKRWSTGSYAPLPNRRPSPFVFHQGHEPCPPQPSKMSSRHSSPTLPNTRLPLNLQNLQSQQQPFFMSGNAAYNRNSMILPSQTYRDPQQFENPPPLLSHGLFRMLQSNADPHSLHSHYAELSDPPDLYASLQEEQVPPSTEDMNPSDADMMPHEQELRFDGDLYTPRWVRGHGNKREGWCGICKPGRWLVLKNSAFWYDKSFTHGISAATGSAFQESQETRRMDGNPDVWEGLCRSCNEWVALVSNKKKGTTWFRHAYKCHSHPKIKDAPKRRRESSHVRAMAAATTNTRSFKADAPSTPHMTTAMASTRTSTPGSASDRKTLSPHDGAPTMI